MLTLIRTLILLSLLSFSSGSWAACNYFWDKIRDNQLSQIDCHSEDGNGVLIIDYRERRALLQYKSAVRQAGIHISKPEAFKWPVFTNVKFTIRFDPDIPTILRLVDSGVMKDKHMFLWPPCSSRPDLSDNCGGGLPRIDREVWGEVWRYTASDQRTATRLVVAQPKDFENFEILVRGSGRIVLEVGVTQGPSQLEFIR